MTKPRPLKPVLDVLHQGVVIPAHPLALNSQRKLDERRQRALTRYYCAAGAGGIAIGVHTTQFEIHQPKIGLYEPVLTLASETLDEVEAAGGKQKVRIAGIVGTTSQATVEAALAKKLGFHLGLVSLSALADKSNSELIAHLLIISEIIPIFGFYLQPAVGGRILNYDFWRQTVEIENLMAIKIAPFNRYHTLDVVRAVADSGRANHIALYTGNDDSIVFDLLSEFKFSSKKESTLRIVGGLLGQWAVWTKKAVELLQTIQGTVKSRQGFPGRLLLLAQQITDANAAIFDAKNQFAGCIAGIHEILRRQGLLEGRWTLNPKVDLSPGQMQDINRIYQAYPHLNDDEFVQTHLDEWMR